VLGLTLEPVKDDRPAALASFLQQLPTTAMVVAARLNISLPNELIRSALRLVTGLITSAR